MDNFFPSYMNLNLYIGRNAEFRYNREYLIGMMYIKGYKKNPIHYELNTEDDLIKYAKRDYARIISLLKDSKKITSKKNGNERLRKIRKIY